MQYYLIGIKGSGMSALACILKDLGHDVSGSDIKEHIFTQDVLEQKEIKMNYFDIDNITNDIDMVIVGNAFTHNNIEFEYVLNNNINYRYYYTFINEFAKKYQAIGIAGTNGKTTTTGIVNALYRDENIISLIGDGTGVGHNNAKRFIFEACEYKETFLNYFPNIGLINNIEMDHPDFFTSIKHVREVYQKYANQCGLLIINGDDENCQIIEHKNKYTYGLKKDNNLVLYNLNNTSEGFSFNLSYNNQQLGTYTLPFVGMHMVYNCLAVIMLGLVNNIDINKIINNIATFKGTRRRFETTVISKKKQIILIDDYAHHPTAINLTLAAIKQKYPNYTISVLFQPHTYSRTIEFLDEFAKELIIADNVFLAEIFSSVRETSSEIDINILKKQINKYGVVVEEDLSFLTKISNNHVIAVLGAGNIDQLYKTKIVEMLED